MQMEPRAPGSGRRSCGPVPPGARWQPGLGRRPAAFVPDQWVRFGHARHPHFKPLRSRTRSPPSSAAPRGVHVNLIEVSPEAPGGPMTTTGPGRRSPTSPRSPTPSPTRTGTGTRRAPGRPDGLFDRGPRRVRRHRLVPDRRQATSCSSPGAEAQEQFFRAPDDMLDQAAGVPFMTPVRPGGRLRRPPEERQQMLKNQSCGDMMRATPPSRPRSGGWSHWGDEGRSTCSTSSAS